MHPVHCAGNIMLYVCYFVVYILNPVDIAWAKSRIPCHSYSVSATDTLQKPTMFRNVFAV